MWYNELGFETNPLSIRPTDNNNLVGYEKIIQRMIYQIRIGNVIFLQGSYGTGKSSILNFIRKKFEKNILYFNCSSHKRLRRSIMEKRGFFRKLFLMKPKQMILLVDETHHANPKDFDFLYEYYIMDRIKSIIFTGPDFKAAPFNKAFKADTKLYKLNEIKKNLAVEIVNNRIPNQTIISPVLANRVFLSSGSNPRAYLENLEDMIRKVFALGRDKITKKDVDEFFKN